MLSESFSFWKSLPLKRFRQFFFAKKVNNWHQLWMKALFASLIPLTIRVKKLFYCPLFLQNCRKCKTPFFGKVQQVYDALSSHLTFPWFICSASKYFILDLNSCYYKTWEGQDGAEKVRFYDFLLSENKCAKMIETRNHQKMEEAAFKTWNRFLMVSCLSYRDKYCTTNIGKLSKCHWAQYMYLFLKTCYM